MVLPPETPDVRADRFLKDRFPAVSRAEITAALAQGKIRIGWRCVQKGDLLKAGDRLVLDPSLRWTEPSLRPNPLLSVDIIYADPDILIVNKPAGLPVHPLNWDETETLANAVVARYPELAAVGSPPKEAGFVHRLDTGTSGLVVAARNLETHRSLQEAFVTSEVHKLYLGLVWGRLEGSGEIRQPIAPPSTGTPSSTSATSP
jgi:23S rRNA pseudouridine1911/1915/1917 synthase